MKSRGFTLIELLIAISIISVLSVVGITTFNNIQSKSRDSVRKRDLQRLSTALEIYNQTNGEYVETDTRECTDANSDALQTSIGNLISGSYPADPKDGSKYCYFSENYGLSYRLYAKLENCADKEVVEGTGCSQYNYSLTSDDLEIAAAPAPQPVASLPTPIPSPSPSSAPIPIPAPASDNYRRVFITEANFTGNLGGLAGADDKCLAAARGANLGGVWKAWLSDTSTSAKDRLTRFNGPYRMINAVAIAQNWNDLVDGDLAVPISITETAQLKTGSIKLVWTGTDSNGASYGSGFCSNWTSESGSVPIAGNALRNNTYWTQQVVSNYRCNGLLLNITYAPAGLYCLEQ